MRIGGIFIRFTCFSKFKLFEPMQAEFIGRNTIFLPEVDSTNSYASALLKNVKPPEGTVIRANLQTAGRGQRSKTWQASRGLNITLSAILYPDFLAVQNQHFLYKIAALACYDTIAEILDTGQFDIKIKWPNDILVNRQKLCGILIENNLIDNQIQSSFIGIGLNVNQTEFSELPGAVSIKYFLKRDMDLQIAVERLCVKLELWYQELMKGEFEKIKEQYLKALFGLNQWLDFKQQGKLIRCKPKGLATNGLLQLEREDGSIFETDTHELTWIY